MNRSAIAALVVMLGVGAGLGGGIATAATKSPTIHACERKSSGALRIAKHCHANERVVTWSTIGKPGVKGKQGVVGPAGSTLAATDQFAGVPITDEPGAALITTSGLPDGDYTYSVGITFDNGDDATYDGTCDIEGFNLGSTFAGDQESTQITPSADISGTQFSPGAMRLEGTFTQSANTAFEPVCYTQDPGTHMTATFTVLFTEVSKVIQSAG
jgi:hypothetical protein